MLIRTDYLQQGAVWPPLSESSRVALMGGNYNLYNGVFKRLWEGEEAPRIATNWFRGITRFWRTTMFADPPVFDYGGEGDERVGEYIRALTPSLVVAARAVMTDISRYGVGVFANRTPGLVESVDPRFFFPVVRADDENAIQGYYIAYPYNADPEQRAGVNDSLRAYRFLPDESGVWQGETADFNYSSTTVGEAKQAWTALDRVGSPPIIPVVVDGAGHYGESEYTDISTLVKELQRRESGVSVALDKHNNPHLAVPEGALTADANGVVRLAADGMAIPVPDGANNPEYVTWNADFSEHDKAIQRTLNRLLTFANVSPVLIDAAQSGGQIPSGAALRRLAILTVNRIRTLRRGFDDAFRQTIAGAVYAASSEALVIDADKVRISWATPLSAGGVDEADGLVMLVNAGIVSPVDAAQAVNRVSRQDAEAIVNEAREREDARNAAQQPPEN